MSLAYSSKPWPVRHEQPERAPAQGAGAGGGPYFSHLLCRFTGLESGMLYLAIYALPGPD